MADVRVQADKIAFLAYRWFACLFIKFGLFMKYGFIQTDVFIDKVNQVQNR